MTKRIVIRLIRLVTLLIGLSILTFSLIHMSPMDPVNAYVGGDSSASPEQIEKIKDYWGVDKSPVEQYFSWAGALLQGNFGMSKLYRLPVIEIIKSRALTSFALMGVAWLLSGLLGYLLGIVSAINRGKTIDKVIKWYSYTLVSTPIFWLGLILLIVFAVGLKWFPVGLAAPAGVLESEVFFVDRVRHFVLPALTLSILGVANIAMHTREKMIDILNTEYVIFAKARGESKWEIFKNHGFRNSILPAISLQFAYFGELFGGSVLAEQVFAYPGLGSTLTTAGLSGDLPLLMGIILISSLFVFMGNFIADILNTVVDPRIRGGGREMMKKKPEPNVKKKMVRMLGFSSGLLLFILILSFVLSDENLRVSATGKNLPPSLQHLFGTDWLGRDMFTRTLKGLRLSLAVGAFASVVSVIVATVMGICAATFGKAVDDVISWVIDLFIGMPHLVFMVLLSFIAGGGIQGIVLGVSLTHWTALARVVRSEVLQIKNSEYIHISRSYGKSSWYIAGKHILPAVFPQILIGFLLMFPHVILHEAALTFLGFGLSPQTPAIGIILSEAMSHISTGKWWLVLFPGLLLVVVIKSFDNIGEQIRILMEPASSNE